MSCGARFALVLLAILLASPATRADGSVKSAAPYFEAYAAGKRIEALPLAMTKVDVLVGGIIAEVSLTQVYENRGDVPVEAVYVFPASSRATVHAVSMTIGNRVIRAVLREREEARKTYEAARAEGKTATLLEQQDVGAFRMNVANVLPGDRITVELDYVELLVPNKGTYEFFFPNTAPMAKYRKPGDRDASMPSSSVPEVVDHGFDLKVRVLAAVPIASIDSPSHAVDIQRPRPDEADVSLTDTQRAGARDFVLRYSLLGDEVQTGVLLQEGAEENFFLLMAQPPRTVRPAAIPKREYIFVVDVSGSMTGRPLDVSRKLVADLFKGLRESDRFNVILFAGSAEVMAETSQPATPALLEKALETLDGRDASGGTDLAVALDRAYSVAPMPGMARSIIVITDGAIAAGGDVSRLVSSRLPEANFFVFGIGDSLDRMVIERLARAGQGEPFVVERMSEAEAIADLFREYVDRPLLTQVRVRWEGIDVFDVEPAQVPDLFAERPIILIGKYRGPPQGSVTINGYSGAEQVRLDVDFGAARKDSSLAALPQLWARRRIDRLEDMGCESPCETEEARQKEIAGVGLKYGVLTPYTSFVAVTEEVRTSEQGVAVQQPAMSRENPAAASMVGYGFSPAFAVRGIADSIGGSARARVETPRSPSALREVGGHRMHEVEGGWRDLSHRDDARILRIRRGSAAFRALLVLRPGLAEVFALDGHLLVAFGAYSIEITPLGFGEYPEHTLRRALGRG